MKAGEGAVATALADRADSREGDADGDQHGDRCDEDGAAVETTRKFFHFSGLFGVLPGRLRTGSSSYSGLLEKSPLGSQNSISGVRNEPSPRLPQSFARWLRWSGLGSGQPFASRCDA